MKTTQVQLSFLFLKSGVPLGNFQRKRKCINRSKKREKCRTLDFPSPFGTLKGRNTKKKNSTNPQRHFVVQTNHTFVTSELLTDVTCSQNSLSWCSQMGQPSKLMSLAAAKATDQLHPNASINAHFICLISFSFLSQRMTLSTATSRQIG